ncbi:MAG: choice-of-anchor X domain-containing protein [Spirochaetaceae bacterium]|nr:choice-of-anchor X domain-containing protein [Spirochaetaceae bacterium]
MSIRRTPFASILCLIAVAWVASVASCASLGQKAAETQLLPSKSEVEAGGELSLSLRLAMPGGTPRITWATSSGELRRTAVANEVDLIAPDSVGDLIVTAVAETKSARVERSATIKVLPRGALKKTATVVVEVDCGTLKGVWVDEAHPAENFAPPLKIKGTFRMDEETGEAFAGGSWPVYAMRDDGARGDKAAGDGIWTIRFEFEKTDSKVYFAFDDENQYRAGFESGLAWRFKLAWRGVDSAGAGEVSDENNLFFIPVKDQVVSWTAGMAATSGMYAPTAN